MKGFSPPWVYDLLSAPMYGPGDQKFPFQLSEHPLWKLVYFLSRSILVLRCDIL